MQVIQALQSDSLKHFKTMNQGSENIKPQRYPGQNVEYMSLGITYQCQALTIAGIWDYQLCLSILSAFLLADGNELYHDSLIMMKVTLEDEVKKVRLMEEDAGMTHLLSKGLTLC